MTPAQLSALADIEFAAARPQSGSVMDLIGFASGAHGG